LSSVTRLAAIARRQVAALQPAALRWALSLAVLLGMMSPILAAEWPTSPIHLIVPFTPGASTDVVVRAIAPKLSELLATPVVVDNRGGAGGLIATETVAKANADGYTLLVVTTSFAALPAITDKPPYDALKDFAPIALVADLPGVLVINPAIPVKTFTGFLSYAKTHTLTYGSAGVGTFPHLGVELLKSRAGIPLMHVPYKGATQALTDVIAGHVDLKLDAYVSANAYIREGSLRPLAVTSLTRLPELPDVPTVAEAGFPGFEATYWIGVVAPAAVPEPVRDKLERAVIAALTAENRAFLMKTGIRPLGQGHDILHDLIARESDQWRALAQASDLTIK
jgi:tripartite-type tricarboxylate transporter receptor subunit TctC